MKCRNEMTCRLVFAVVAMSLASRSFAETRRVVAREDDRVGVWTSASLDLAATVASAQPGDEIVVGEGTYAFASAIAVTAANLTIRSSRLDADEPASETTVLDAGDVCRFFTCATAGTAPVFRGFTFRNGNAGSQNGGALLFDSAGAWIVSDCVFENNAATANGHLGGAIVSAGCVGGLVTNCVFRGNVASFGAAVGLYQVTDAPTDKCTLVDCLFTNNVLRAVDRNCGGAAVWAAQGARLVNCRIVENAVEYVSEVPITGGIVKLGNNSTVVGTTLRQTDDIPKYSVTESTKDLIGCCRVMGRGGVTLADDPTVLPDMGCCELQTAEYKGTLLIFR